MVSFVLMPKILVFFKVLRKILYFLVYFILSRLPQNHTESLRLDMIFFLADI